MKFPKNFEEASKQWKELMETVGLEKIKETLTFIFSLVLKCASDIFCK